MTRPFRTASSPDQPSRAFNAPQTVSACRVDDTPLPRTERSTTLTITPGSLRWIQPSSTISASFCSFADTSYAPAFEMI